MMPCCLTLFELLILQQTIVLIVLKLIFSLMPLFVVIFFVIIVLIENGSASFVFFFSSSFHDLIETEGNYFVDKKERDNDDGKSMSVWLRFYHDSRPSLRLVLYRMFTMCN